MLLISFATSHLLCQSFFRLAKSSRWFKDPQNLIVEQITSLQDIILQKQVWNLLLHESSHLPKVIYFANFFFSLAKSSRWFQDLQKCLLCAIGLFRVDNMLVISFVKSHLLCQFFFRLAKKVISFAKSHLLCQFFFFLPKHLNGLTIFKT